MRALNVLAFDTPSSFIQVIKKTKAIPEQKMASINTGYQKFQPKVIWDRVPFWISYESTKGKK